MPSKRYSALASVILLVACSDAPSAPGISQQDANGTLMDLPGDSAAADVTVTDAAAEVAVTDGSPGPDVLADTADLPESPDAFEVLFDTQDIPSDADADADADEVDDVEGGDSDDGDSSDLQECAVPWFEDLDNDGVGNSEVTLWSCEQPEGFVADDGDCNDLDPNNFPGNTEVCDGKDNDCDETTSFPGEQTDADGDSVLSCSDCDDSDPNNYPGNTEVCDGQDNDCNGQADFPEELTDGDGDGSPACVDCDDADPTNYPGNPEVCDAKDNDCNGLADFPKELIDDDGDLSVACNDCDDADMENFPGNVEVCDGKDNNCDGEANFPGELVNEDGDPSLACSDCNDNDASLYPGNVEACDGIDNDCDGSIDEGLELTSFYPDADEDGYGAPAPVLMACAAPAGFVADGTDCDDTDINVFPGQTSYFATPSIGGGYDYDCSGDENKHWNDKGSCNGAVWVCNGSDGWDDKVPDCGETDGYYTGCPSTLTCNGNKEDRTQECR